MRTPSIYPTMVGVLAALSLATAAVAQDRSALLTAIDIQRLVADAQPSDHAQLRDHFAAVAEEYEAAATRDSAAAQTMTGKPNHPPAVEPGTRFLRKAEMARTCADTLRALAQHHDLLAQGRRSHAPADAARFEKGEGAPAPIEAHVRELVASARTRADHQNLHEYFTAVAEAHRVATNTYRVRAQGYRGLDRQSALYAAMHWDRMAARSHAAAAEAHAAAAEQRRLASHG